MRPRRLPAPLLSRKQNGALRSKCSATYSLEGIAPVEHLEYLPGTFFGPLTLVEMVRHRARTQPRDIAFRYLKDGELDQVDLTYAELDRQPAPSAHG